MPSTSSQGQRRFKAIGRHIDLWTHKLLEAIRHLICHSLTNCCSTYAFNYHISNKICFWVNLIKNRLQTSLTSKFWKDRSSSSRLAKLSPQVLWPQWACCTGCW
jgi:hypothetical protein